jgi:hypothetical protein
MKHTDLLKTAAGTINDRHYVYGDHDACFSRASSLASIILGKPISTYDVAMILHSVKLARIRGSRTHEDSYVDGINYLAFAGEFAQQEDSVVTAMEDDIAEMARKLAPVKSEG